jgi:hypothetical protein
MGKWLVLLVAGAIVVPIASANPIASRSAVEGHTTYVDIVIDETPTISLGAVAGSVTCRVTANILWFNDQELFRLPPTANCLGSKRFVYASEHLTPDPRGNPTLNRSGLYFDFTDPNGIPWHVVEYTYSQASVRANGVLDPQVLLFGLDLQVKRYYTYVVEIGPMTRDPTINKDYNFVDVVDLGKFLTTCDGCETHNGSPGAVENGNSHNQYSAYEEHLFPHNHDKVDVDMSLGEQPPNYYAR